MQLADLVMPLEHVHVGADDLRMIGRGPKRDDPTRSRREIDRKLLAMQPEETLLPELERGDVFVRIEPQRIEFDRSILRLILPIENTDDLPSLLGGFAVQMPD